MFHFFLVLTKKNLLKLLKARSTFYMVMVVFIFLLLYFKPVACGEYGDRVDLLFSSNGEVWIFSGMTIRNCVC